MGLLGCMLLLLSPAVVFTIADENRFKKYEAFEGLFESVFEDLENQVAGNRRISMTGGTLKAKQWEESGYTDNAETVLSYIKGELPFGPKSSASPTEQTITSMKKTDGQSTDPSTYIAGYATMPVATEKGTSTEESASYYSMATSGSTTGYITVEPATAEQKVTSTPEAVSPTAHSSSSEGYRTADPMTEQTAVSTSKSDGSSENPSSSSTPGYSPTSPAVEKQKEESPSESSGTSAAPSSSMDTYSTFPPATEQTFTQISDSSSVSPPSSTSGYSPVAEQTKIYSSESSSYFTESPDDDESYDQTSVKHPLRVGSIRGIPGEHFPDYTDIPITDFSCSDKPVVPGFYADMDAGCQVFHVCWSDRRETFLCPVGTTFNQAILACDYWYSNNCSLAPQYYSVNMGDTGLGTLEVEPESVSSMIDVLLESSTAEPSEVAYTPEKELDSVSAISFVSKFLPVKAKVTLYTESTESYYETTQSSVDEQEGLTYETLPKVSVSSSDPEVTQTVLESSSEDDLNPSVRPAFDRAISQASEDIDEYFMSLLQVEQVHEGIQILKAFYEAFLRELTNKLWNRTFDPSYVDFSTVFGEGKAYKDKAQEFRLQFVNLMKFFARSFENSDCHRFYDCYRKVFNTEAPWAAAVGPLTEQIPTEGEIDKFVSLTKLMPSKTTSKAESGGRFEDSTKEADRDEEMQVGCGVTQGSDERKFATEDPRVETVATLAKLMEPETTPQADWDESREDSVEELVGKTYTEAVQQAIGQSAPERLQFTTSTPVMKLNPKFITKPIEVKPIELKVSTVAPLTKLNPRFITKPIELKPVEHKVSMKTTEAKKSVKWGSNSSLSTETKKALLLNYMNFLKNKAKSF